MLEARLVGQPLMEKKSPEDKCLIELFAAWFDDPTGGRPLLSAVRNIGAVQHVSFDSAQFTRAVEASNLVTDFETCLRDQPLRILSRISKALMLYRTRVLNGLKPTLWHSIRVHFTGLHPELRMSNLKSSFVGKFVRISGYVVRVSTIQPLVTRVSFECLKCGCVFQAVLEDGKFETPMNCGDIQCKSKTFELMRGSAQTIGELVSIFIQLNGFGGDCIHMKL